MDETATVAIVAVAAIALFFLVKRQEAQTAMLLAQLNKPKASGSKALSFEQVLAVVGTVGATYVGGPEAGYKAAQALAPR